MSKLLQKAAKAKKDLEEETPNAEENALITKSISKKRKAKAPDTGSHIVYIGHIPEGFFEMQMRSFFSQFGEVKKIKVFRSAKTMRSKGYGFVEFETPEVAAVVASTMNGYFLGERQLVCDVVPKDKVHDRMFIPNKRKTLRVEAEPAVLTDGETAEKSKKKAIKYCEAREQKKEKLRSLGLEFELPAPITHTTPDDDD